MVLLLAYVGKTLTISKKTIWFGYRAGILAVSTYPASKGDLDLQLDYEQPDRSVEPILMNRLN